MATHHPPEIALHLGPDDEGRALTADEFATAVYAEPWRYERVDGRLVVMSPIGEDHVRASSPWRNRLGAYQLQHPEIVAEVVSEAWLRIRAGSDRIGDIGVYLVRTERALGIPERAPELMFEFVSASAEDRRRDYIEKRQDYYRAGVHEYVIVDGFETKVTVLTHTPDGYQERVLGIAETYTSPLLPGLAIPLAEVFAS